MQKISSRMVDNDNNSLLQPCVLQPWGGWCRQTFHWWLLHDLLFYRIAARLHVFRQCLLETMTAFLRGSSSSRMRKKTLERVGTQLHSLVAQKASCWHTVLTHADIRSSHMRGSVWMCPQWLGVTSVFRLSPVIWFTALWGSAFILVRRSLEGRVVFRIWGCLAG